MKHNFISNISGYMLHGWRSQKSFFFYTFQIFNVWYDTKDFFNE